MQILPKKVRTDSKAYIQLTTISGTFNDQLGAYERTVWYLLALKYNQQRGNLMN